MCCDLTYRLNVPYQAAAPQAILRNFHVGDSLSHRGQGDQPLSMVATRQRQALSCLKPRRSPERSSMQGRYTLLSRTLSERRRLVCPAALRRTASMFRRGFQQERLPSPVGWRVDHLCGWARRTSNCSECSKQPKLPGTSLQPSAAPGLRSASMLPKQHRNV